MTLAFVAVLIGVVPLLMPHSILRQAALPPKNAMSNRLPEVRMLRDEGGGGPSAGRVTTLLRGVRSRWSSPRARPRRPTSNVGAASSGAALMWQRLGAFSGLQDDAEVRRDFAVLDADANGKVSANELYIAVKRVAPVANGLCWALTYHMLDFADTDGDGLIDLHATSDGLIDLDEFRSLREATAPADHMLRFESRVDEREWGI